MSEVSSEIKEIAFHNVDEILEFAIKSEESSNRFYAEWAKKLTDKPIKKVFEELAVEELKHKEYIQGIKEGKTLSPAKEEVIDLKISDYMVDIKASLEMDYQDALTMAMHREKMAFKLYSHLANISINENMKSTFKVLAQEEAKHKLHLEMIYDDDILKEN
jgi:rubrerythrin